MSAGGNPAMIRSTLVASLAFAALAAPPLFAQTPGTLTNCNGDTGSCSQTRCSLDYRGNMACITNTLAPPEPERMPSKKERQLLACEARERERQWVAYCTPEVYVDAGGISRYRYAK